MRDWRAAVLAGFATVCAACGRQRRREGLRRRIFLHSLLGEAAVPSLSSSVTPPPRRGRGRPPHRSRGLVWWAAIALPLFVALLAVSAGIALASHRTITPGEARAVATAVNLRHGDLPSLQQSSNSNAAQDERFEMQEAACIGQTPQSDDLAHVSSANFDGPASAPLSVSSKTAILPSAAVAAANVAAGARRHALTCLGTYAGKELLAELPAGSTVTTMVAFLPTVVPGADGVAAARVAAVLHEKQGTTTASAPLYADLIEFAYGQADVTLGVASKSMPSRSLEARLLALLVTRARAAIG